MRLIIHREIPEDENLRQLWNALVQQMERPEVFYTYEWALAVARSYGTSMAPLLFLAYEGSSLVGLVALACAGTRDETCFLAGTTADYCDFVSHPQKRAEFVEMVFRELCRMKGPMLRLANLPADSATCHALRSGARNYGYSVYSRPAYFCSQVAFRSGHERQTLKQSVEHKQMLRRYLKAMGKLGPVSLIHLQSGDGIAKALPEFSRTHVARFLSTGRISNLARPQRRAFLAELGRLLSRPGWVTLTQLMVGERVAAWNYGFQFAGSWFWYQPTFDIELHQYSPGFCLLAKIVEEACDNPSTNFVDFGLGAEGYKERLATGGRQTLHVIATKSNLHYAREAVRHRAATAIKAVPRLEAWVRLGLARCSSLRRRLRGTGALGLPAWVGERVSEGFRQKEVLFFEWTQREAGNAHARSTLVLQPLDLNLLAVAAMQYVDEPETATYLMRAAKRLRAKGSRGFALVTTDGVPVHFCWATDFAGFHMAELDHTLSDPASDAVLVSDCWTPASVRGRGYYGVAISAAASKLTAAGKQPWIFSAATNMSSIRGLEKAGFTKSFSLTRHRFLFWSKVVQSHQIVHGMPLSHVSAAD